MAGIGFTLRKLANEDNFSGFLRAYFHSGVIAVGPWIMIVLSVASIFIFSSRVLSITELNEFLAVFIYNLCFSFILSGPIYLVTARYVSDCLYLRYLDPLPGIFAISIVFVAVPAIIIATLFYVFYASMTPFMTIVSIANFFLFCQTWVTMLFLALLRDYKAVTFSWVVGMLIAIFLALYYGSVYLVEGIMVGINIGLCFLTGSLTSNVFVEYPYSYQKPKGYRYYFDYYNGLFWSGLFLFAAMWIDKVIMWFTPEATIHLNNLRTYPVYDGGMFFSYLTIIPLMALFTFNLEANFYDSYVQYVKKLEANAPLSSLEEERVNIFSQIKEDARSFLILQGVISLIVIIFAPEIFQFLGTSFLELSIFRLGTLGAFFSALCFFIVIIFSYFDSQDNMMKVTAMMLVTNMIGTLVSLYFGFTFYGCGFCFSMIISFFYAANLFVNFMSQLHYHIFVTNNVKRQEIREVYLENTLLEYLKKDASSSREDASS